MKTKNILVTLIFITLSAISMEAKDTVPVVNGKVLFSDTIKVKESSDMVHEKIVDWVTSYLSTRKGALIENDTVNHEVSVRVVDYLEMERKAFSLFAIYIKYTLNIKQEDGKCIVRIGGIKYIEPEGIEKESPTVFDGEEILIQKRYKVLFVKNAADKIKTHTIQNFDQLFSSLQEVLE